MSLFANKSSPTVHVTNTKAPSVFCNGYYLARNFYLQVCCDKGGMNESY